MYLTQGDMAADLAMCIRVASCAAQEGVTDVGLDPDVWTRDWRRVWSAAPGWDAAWESAVAGGVPDPGSDPGVITDGMIRSQVQAMMPFQPVTANLPVPPPPLLPAPTMPPPTQTVPGNPDVFYEMDG
jgi:hypothetical protein